MDVREQGNIEPLQVFISSTMKDMEPERKTLRDAIEEIKLKPVFAEKMGARSGTPREVTLSLVRQSDIYVGLFWQRYGEVPSRGLSATEEEYQEALKGNLPILIYIKEPAPKREKLLVRFLQELEQYDRGHFRKTFTSLEELRNQIKCDIMQEVSKLVRQKTTRRFTGDATIFSTEPKEERSVFQLEGVLKLLRDRVLKRVTEQLDPLVKSYKEIDSVERGCRNLAAKIKEDNFIPDVVIGWRNPGSTYPGSEIVSNLIAREMSVPLRIINLKEIGEKREVDEDCSWLKGMKKALIVDDACYSGSTLRAIHEYLCSVDSQIELRFAVLSTLDPNRLPHMYYLTIHNTEELLFPWGWSRLIVGLYDIYKLFGISDRRVVLRESREWGQMETIAEEHNGTVRLLTIEAAAELQREANGEFDTFLYIINGSAELYIGDKTGVFFPSEYVFIPRGIGYLIKANVKTQVLELLSGSE
jgi:hypoxanthine phosphoribosyltransferase/mannose-6-phosphate isomerase-like protein (cupin superfamily)